MSLKRASRKKRPMSPRESKRRELQGYLDRLRQIPDKTPRDMDLQIELQEALRDLKR
jgi:hypothetical protein